MLAANENLIGNRWRCFNLKTLRHAYLATEDKSYESC